MPKMYPRGGGPHDQDPLLMRHFREIRKLELSCKESKETLEKVKNDQAKGGGLGGLDSALEGFIEEQLGEDGEGYF